ncbi:MAG: cupin domain-containing protein [Acidimicrobiia bacterium]|nr:cupin domain-containing protein [Acidimicrobiia bacterium]
MPGYITQETDVSPVVDPDDTVSTRTTIDASVGAEHLEQRVLHFATGRSRARHALGRDEVAYVVSGSGTLVLAGDSHELTPDMGVYIRAGEGYEVDNPGAEDLVLVSVTAPEPSEGDVPVERSVTVRVADQPTIPAGKDREFRFVINPDAGCRDVTQFVGWIPPGRAPTHHHLYDEVIYVLDGSGVLHLEGQPDVPISTGSCIHLPPPVQHCLENTGDRPLRVLGVFHPAGSAAEAYENDTNE